MLLQNKLLHGHLIRRQARYGCHHLNHGRRLPRHGGHLEDGKSSKINVQGFRLQAIAIPLLATVCVNTAPHRAHFTHANIFLRVAQGLETVQHALFFP